ncbi:MAG: respiratory chain complex I subunit 1 family protein [Verrucomicrobiia bacterium]
MNTAISMQSLINFLLAIACAPLLIGLINRTKAWFAGRRGQPLFQLYYDLVKLARKGAVYSRTTGWLFRAGPIVGLAAAVVAAAIVPFGGSPALIRFDGDLVLWAYCFGLMRFLTVLAAMDTGSSFEGMGASREVTFAALAEPAMFLALAALARRTESLSLSGIYAGIDLEVWRTSPALLLLIIGSLVVVLLAENSRIPVDDPNTHLELTMIHEVMVLDHGGPDFGFVLYGGAVKLWAMSALISGLIVPAHFGPWSGTLAGVLCMFVLAIGVGIIESAMARLRLLRVPELLVGGAALSAVALMITLS